MRIPAKYTEVLKNMIDDEQVKPLLDKALSTYPMYVPKNDVVYTIIPTREQLNEKLLNKYKYKEIGFETIGRFLDELEIAMNEIMPYYYQLFKSADIMNGIDDPFGNVDITEKFEQETTGNSEGKSNTKTENKSNASSTSVNKTDITTNSKEVKSDTPQGQLDIGTKNIDNLNYGSEASWNENISNSKGNNQDTSSATGETSASGSSSSNSHGTTKHTFTKVGNQGVNTYAHDMKELREIFLNIEKQIIEDERISELFMNVY